MTSQMTDTATRHNEGKPTFSYLFDFDQPITLAWLLFTSAAAQETYKALHNLYNAERDAQITLSQLGGLLIPNVGASGGPETGREVIALYLSLLAQVNKVSEKGAEKYAPRNWQKGLSVRGCFDSAVRHLLKLDAGIENDEEMGTPHTAHVLWNVMAAQWTIKNKPEFDDRDKHLPEKSMALETTEKQSLKHLAHEIGRKDAPQKEAVDPPLKSGAGVQTSHSAFDWTNVGGV